MGQTFGSRFCAGLIAACAACLANLPARAASYAPGLFESYTPDLWSSPTTPEGGTLLENDFDFELAYPYPYILILGDPALVPTHHTIIFDGGEALIPFMAYANGGPNGPLTNVEILDPTSSSGGDLAQDVVALLLDVSYSDAGLLGHPIGVAFGDLVITGLIGEYAFLNGHSVRDFAETANLALAGQSLPLSYDDLASMVYRVAGSFIVLPDYSLHYVSDFADAHLVYPSKLGAVTCADIALLKASLGSSAGQAAYNPRADVNQDGTINNTDLSLAEHALPSGTVCN
jgi:hypothetical protein